MNTVKVKVTSNAKSLSCDTANEHALERHAAAVRLYWNTT